MLFASDVKRQEIDLQKWLAPHADAYQISQLPVSNSQIGKKVSEAKTGASSYLLTGLLRTPDGDLWTGSGNQHYRTRPDSGKKGRWLNKEKVDTAITEQLLSDIVSPEFVSKVTQATKEGSKLIA